MQIEFVKRTDIDLKSIPKTQWGRALVRRETLPPVFEDSVGPVLPQSGESIDYFPIGTVADLPEAMATKFIESGAAKLAEDPDEVRAMPDSMLRAYQDAAALQSTEPIDTYAKGQPQ